MFATEMSTLNIWLHVNVSFFGQMDSVNNSKKDSVNIHRTKTPTRTHLSIPVNSALHLSELTARRDGTCLRLPLGARPGQVVSLADEILGVTGSTPAPRSIQHFAGATAGWPTWPGEPGANWNRRRIHSKYLYCLEGMHEKDEAC